MPRRTLLAVLAATALLVPAGGADARDFGSSLRRAANAGWGCESVPYVDTLQGPVLGRSGFGTCFVRSVGRVFSNKNWAIVPGGEGRITRYRVRAGRNPAPLRFTVVTASARANPVDLDNPQPSGGDFLCCTLRYLGPRFRPRAGRVTTRRANIRTLGFRKGNTSYFDIVGLTAVGRGTLPLRDEGSFGTFRTGSALTNLYYPAMRRRGDSRVDYAYADGFELLMRWTWRPR